MGATIADWANRKTTLTKAHHHPYVIKFARWCHKNNVRPLRGEFVVADPSSGYSTGVDLIVQRDVIQEGKRVTINELIEIKCGIGGYWMVPQGKMMAPLQEIDNCPFRQAMVQLAVTTELFRRYKPEVPIHSAAVVHIYSGGMSKIQHQVDLHPFDLRELDVIGRKALVEMAKVRYDREIAPIPVLVHREEEIERKNHGRELGPSRDLLY